MRFLIRAMMTTERGTAAITSGRLGPTVQAILEEQQPEAIYFTAEGGYRTAYFVIDIPSSSDLPRIAEPWFLAFDATVEFFPVMSPEDLAKAGPAIGAAVQKYTQ